MPFNTIHGLRIIVNRYHCAMKVIGQKRKHRKKRINLKWRKKYGVVTKCTQDLVFEMGGKLIVCPHQMAAFEAEYGCSSNAPTASVRTMSPGSSGASREPSKARPTTPTGSPADFAGNPGSF